MDCSRQPSRRPVVLLTRGVGTLECWAPVKLAEDLPYSTQKFRLLCPGAWGKTKRLQRGRKNRMLSLLKSKSFRTFCVGVEARF